LSKMAIKGIGIDASAPRLDGNLEILEKDLDFFERCGFDYVEIPVHGVDVVVGGRLNERRAAQVRRILAGFDLKYTVHLPDPLNLFDVERLNLHKEIFLAGMEFANSIGAEVVVYHGGAINASNEDLKLPLENFKAIEREVLIELAEVAAPLGIKIGVENAGPDSYSARLNELIEQVQEINSPNVGITLDFGHAYLTAHLFGFDFIGAIREAAPYAIHLHVHDNFGQTMPFEMPQIFHVSFGNGDLHMPPGWGEIPYDEVFSFLSTPPVVLLLEIRPRYMDQFKEVLKEARRLASLASSNE